MPMLGSPIEDLKRPRINRGDLVGVVIDNDDPMKRQRVKIRVPIKHRGVSDEDLPWALQDSSQGTANAGQGVGGVNVPPIGSKLYYRIEDNDPHNPRYGSSPPTDDVNKDNELLKDDYPHTRGFTDHAGNRWDINAEKQTVAFTHKSGTTIHIDANGTTSVTAFDINLAASNNINMTGKKINLAASDSVNLNGKNGVNVDGSRIDLNGGKAPGGSSGTRTARPRPQIPNPSGNITA